MDSDGLECDILFLDFIPKSISKLDSNLAELEKIDTKLNGNLNIKISPDYKLSSLLFNFNAKNGSFYYPQFFSKTINFNNFFQLGIFKTSQ